MTAAATSTPLLVKVPAPRPAVETHPLLRSPPADAEARRLAAAIARGDERAFGEFYEGYHRRLFRLALVLASGDESLAQDAVQAAFIVAARKLRGAESAEHLWNWLARVTRQQIARGRKRCQREAALVGVAELPDGVADSQSDSVLEERLDAALRALAVDERQVIESFYFDGLSQKEIAERLATTPKAVSSRLERARAKLRTAIAQKLAHET
jgi:RNA polymerase sigma-70 factor (ECF subfamily)